MPGTEDYRAWSPGISQAKWNELLVKNGFSGIDFIFHDYENETCKEVSVLVTTAAAKPPSISLPPIEILVEPSSGEQNELAGSLQAQLKKQGLEVQTRNFKDLSSTEISDKTVYLFLMEYEKPVLECMDPTSFSIMKSVTLSGRAVMWVTGGGGSQYPAPGFGVVDGLSRTLRNENGNLSFVSVALDRSHNDKEKHCNHISQILSQTL